MPQAKPLDESNYRKQVRNRFDRIRFENDPAEASNLIRISVGASQVAIYVMAGGGMIGRSFAEQPKEAYVDSRASKRPYSMSQMENARQAFIIEVEEAGFNPDNIPFILPLGNMGGNF